MFVSRIAMIFKSARKNSQPSLRIILLDDMELGLKVISFYHQGDLLEDSPSDVYKPVTVIVACKIQVLTISIDD